jgi:hypothetical protein
MEPKLPLIDNLSSRFPTLHPSFLTIGPFMDQFAEVNLSRRRNLTLSFRQAYTTATYKSVPSLQTLERNRSLLGPR